MRAMVAGLLLASAVAAAQIPAEFRPDPKAAREYAELVAQVGTQKGAKQAETLGKMAEFEFGFARAAFLAHQPEQGRQQLQQAMAHADSACAELREESKKGKTNGMQKVEMSLQNIGYGLHDLSQDVDFEQRGAVDAAGAHVANLRAELLNLMFAPKH